MLPVVGDFIDPLRSRELVVVAADTGALGRELRSGGDSLGCGVAMNAVRLLFPVLVVTLAVLESVRLQTLLLLLLLLLLAGVLMPRFDGLRTGVASCRVVEAESPSRVTLGSLGTTGDAARELVREGAAGASGIIALLALDDVGNREVESGGPFDGFCVLTGLFIVGARAVILGIDGAD